MRLQHIFSKESIIPDLQSTDKDELFEEMLQAVVNAQPELNREEVLSALKERESKMTSGIIHSIAVPHCRVDTAHGIVGSIGIARNGIDYDSLDGAPVRFVFMLVCNSMEDSLHLEALKSLALVLKNPQFIQNLSECKSAAEVFDLLGKSEFFFEN